MIKTLSKKQWLGLIILSVGFWYNGVYLVSFISQNDWWSGLPMLTIFALSVPIAVIAVSGVVSLMKLSFVQTLPTISFIVGLVSAFHTLALINFPQLYQISNFDPMPYIWLLWFCVAVLIPTTLRRTN